MKVVLDTSAIIYLSDFRKFDEIFTVQAVVNEVKDRISSIKLSSLNIKIVEPSNETLEEIIQVAKNTGDLEKLSKTDLKIIALAKERGLTIVSDDRNIQNVAEKLNLKYISVFSGKIKKLVTWRKFCRSCQRYSNKENFCPTCGGRLVRVWAKSTDVVKR
jgi:UPF0271 protein